MEDKIDYLTAERIVMQRLANEKGKDIDWLIPWDDYDPIWVDMEIKRIRSGSGVVYQGD